MFSLSTRVLHVLKVKLYLHVSDTENKLLLKDQCQNAFLTLWEIVYVRCKFIFENGLMEFLFTDTKKFFGDSNPGYIFSKNMSDSEQVFSHENVFPTFGNTLSVHVFLNTESMLGRRTPRCLFLLLSVLKFWKFKHPRAFLEGRGSFLLLQTEFSIIQKYFS